LDDYKRRGGRGAETIESVVRRNVLPELGGLVVHKLTTRRLLEWHRSIAAAQLALSPWRGPQRGRV
jgi:hypothetical protein